MIVLNENHLRKVLKEYFHYCTESRTHLALGKDCPEPRGIETAGTATEWSDL